MRTPRPPQPQHPHGLIFSTDTAARLTMQRHVRGMNCMPTVCVDTNIWIYALSVPNTGDASKHQIAQSSIQTAGKITLTPQIINELGFALRRKHTWTDDDLRPMFTHLLGSCTLHIPSSDWHLNALELRSILSLSYWDSLIVAAALEAGCHTLISEDMQHQQQIDGLRIINPFK
jgi:predicted nucleic acid-binding protein